MNDEIKIAIKEKFWDMYFPNTVEVSSICRQIAFAEGAVCWFFKQQNQPLPSNVLFILKILALFFILDGLQYFVAAIIYWVVAKYAEYRNRNGQIRQASDIQRKWWMNIVSVVLFYTKVIVIGIASYYVIFTLLK